MTRSISTIAVITALAGVALVPAVAGAADLSATQLLNTYSAVIFGGLTSTSDMEGSALVGGNVSGGGYAGHSNSPNAPHGLTVGGNTSGNIQVNSGRGAAIAGNISSGSVIANSGNIYLQGTGGNLATANGGGHLYTGSAATAQTSPIAGEVSTAETELKAYSAQLSALGANSTATLGSNLLTFNAAPNANGVAVFDFTASTFAELSSVGQYQFNLNGAKEVIINVSGVDSTQLNIAANFLGGGAQALATDTVWNFTDATNIHINAQFGGDILADYAGLTTTGNIEGSVVAASLTQGAEIHYDGQNANLVSPVPLPAALPLFGAAIAGLGVFGLRKKANKSA